MLEYRLQFKDHLEEVAALARTEERKLGGLIFVEHEARYSILELNLHRDDRLVSVGIEPIGDAQNTGELLDRTSVALLQR